MEEVPFMPGFVSNTSYDHSNADIVSVIASFDTDGRVKPLYARIHEDTLKIHSSWLKPSFQGLMEFQCKVIDHDCLKPLILIYHKVENVWTIPKIFL